MGGGGGAHRILTNFANTGLNHIFERRRQRYASGGEFCACARCCHIARVQFSVLRRTTIPRRRRGKTVTSQLCAAHHHKPSLILHHTRILLQSISSTLLLDWDSSVGAATPLLAERSGVRIPVVVKFFANVHPGPGATHGDKAARLWH